MKLERVTRCHARVVHRRIIVWTTITRHGKKIRIKRRKTIKVVELPHVVMHTSQRVGHGRRTTCQRLARDAGRDSTRRTTRRTAHRTRQRGGPLHRRRSGRDRSERDLERPASCRTVACDRGFLRRRAHARAERLSPGTRDHPGEGEVAERLATPRGMGRYGADHRTTARRLFAAWWGAGAVADRKGRASRPTACRSM